MVQIHDSLHVKALKFKVDGRMKNQQHLMQVENCNKQTILHKVLKHDKNHSRSS